MPSMYDASVPVFAQFLQSLGAMLDKTSAHAASKKIDPKVFLNARLYPDMLPFWRQVGLAGRHASNACARLAGVEPPAAASSEPDFPELQARNAQTVEYVGRFTPERINGSEAKEIVLKYPSGAERRVTGQALLFNLCLPNFYFHVTTAYGILRHNGVELGKRDFNALQHRFSGACACQAGR